MNTIKPEKEGKIVVANISLRHFSRGLYRSTAAVFKELVSNAYDADAMVVRIDTNYPAFDFISCVDNGAGMPLEEFLRYFNKKGIGSCVKRKGNKDTTDIGRPIIGRLGVGMLAMGQLCNSFEIESHYRDENGEDKAYRAEIVLLNIGIPDEHEVIYSRDSTTQETEVGTWKYKEIDYDEKKKGFRIYSSDIRATFRREMKSSIGERELEKMSFRQSDLYSQFYAKAKSVRDCNSYLETIWELAVLCPLPYYEKQGVYPICLSSVTSEESKSEGFKQAIQFMRERQAQLLKHNFRLVFDGIELRRHIRLPSEENTVPKLYFIEFDSTVFDSRLKFSGYLFAQVPRAIRPLELNGVQIRLRGVGIGGYDSTFLKYYKQIETIRSRWVSGEIFVDEGLEEALNIDRDSFNEHDEHYKKLQSFLHEKLDKVFNEISGISRKLSEERHDAKDEELKKSIQTIIAEHSQERFKLLQCDLGKNAPIVTVNEDKGEIILNTTSRPLKKKKANTITGSIMLAYHTAKHTSKTEKEREEKFYQLVKKVLDKLV